MFTAQFNVHNDFHIQMMFVYSLHGHHRMVVGFTTTCVISAYDHYSCELEPRSWRGVLDTALCDKNCLLLATGRKFSPDTPISTTNKPDHHGITAILLKVTTP